MERLIEVLKDLYLCFTEYYIEIIFDLLTPLL